jgi:ribulose 1,5-bisphosphate synthetase/thiazole synthase
MLQLKTLITLAGLPTALAGIDSTFLSFFPIVQKDVVIIGGGGSGAHAAVRLREDYGKSVMVIEKDSILVSFICPY